jgi:Uma2 family endonuclease
MSIETTELVWPPDLLDDEEQDEPLAGQDHRDVIETLHYPLRGRLAGPHCFVAAELRIHRASHDLRDYREPDLLVAFGVVDHVRRRYLMWEEHKAPDLVIECLSPSSADNDDLGSKRIWSREIGVREYIVVDPTGEFAPEPRLQAWRFGDLAAPGTDGEAHVLPGPDGVLPSAVIPFALVVQDGWPRLLDPGTGEIFPPIWAVEPRWRAELQARRTAQAQAEAQVREERAARVEAEERARLAEDRSRSADARARALEEELAALRRQLHRDA